MFYAKMIQSDHYWSQELLKPAPDQNLYLIIDMIQYDDTSNKIVSYLQNQQSVFLHSLSLFKGTIDEELNNVAPYLCQINSFENRLTESERAFLETEEKTSPVLLWLYSQSDLISLHRHLQHFMAGKLNNGREALLRFYDPRVLPKFLTMLTAEQSEQFWNGVDQIALWDSKQQQRMIFRRDTDA